MWVLSNISISWYPLSLKGCVECFPKMQSSHLPPMVSSPVIFRPSTNILTAISWIVSGAACPNLRCHVSKVTGHRFVCDTNAVGVLDMVSIAYRRPHRLAVMIMAPLTDLTRASCWSNSTFTPFSASLDTEIRLERSSGVCSASSKVIFLFVPLTHVSILAFPFPVTLKMDSLAAARPMVGWCNGVSDMNDSLLTKQWSDALESINVGTLNWDFESLLHVSWSLFEFSLTTRAPRISCPSSPVAL